MPGWPLCGSAASARCGRGYITGPETGAGKVLPPLAAGKGWPCRFEPAWPALMAENRWHGFCGQVSEAEHAFGRVVEKPADVADH